MISSKFRNHKFSTLEESLWTSIWLENDTPCVFSNSWPNTSETETDMKREQTLNQTIQHRRRRRVPFLFVGTRLKSSFLTRGNVIEMS